MRIQRAPILLPLLLTTWILFPHASWAVPPGWQTNLVTTLAGTTNTQPVLAYFTASWCGPCKQMAQTTLTNPAVLNLLKDLKHVAIDIDEQPTIAERFEIRAVPTFVLLVASGDVAVTTTGYQDADTFVNWLTNGMNEANAALNRQRETERKLVEIDQLLKAQAEDSQALRKATTELAELCAERNANTRKLALTRLAAVVERAPAPVLDLLNHARLATRIEVANLFRQRLGDDFNVDPWSDPVTRTNLVAAWREKLATATLRKP
jgi:thioredoxin-like negative regulator of GroEL